MERAPDTPAVLHDRRTYTDDRLRALADALKALSAPRLVGRRACVYATGSIGRGDASEFSDLDLFIVSNDLHRGGLSRLESLKLQAMLVTVSEDLGFPPFSGDGEYLAVHSLSRIKERLGKPEDDYTNTFTARMLLLLESRPILGDPTYKRAVKSVVGEYWRDYHDHSRNFKPLFLINDIVRYWKVLCLNYEAGQRSDNATAIAKRRLQNYKLKHSRLLICYSAVIYLTWLYTVAGTVTPANAVKMVALTPTDRLLEVSSSGRSRKIREATRHALEYYSMFLEQTRADKATVVERFRDAEYHKARIREASAFGADLFFLLMFIARENPILRYLVI